ncbi:MAG: AEC family transporter [Proteobacteria bacterium]|nr:AEC family transporter [Pseudomonadota bacterium]
MLGNLFAIIAPLFICAGLGYLWAKREWPFDTAMVTPLAMNIAVPCLAFSAISTLKVDAAAFGELALSILAAFASFLVIGAACLKAAGLPMRTYLPSLTFPNVGNMGLPLCLFAFGDTGVALGMAWYVIASLGHFTVGIWIVSGSASPMILLKTPIVYSLIVAFSFMLTGTEPPKWALNTTQLLGNLGIPLMLLTLGVSLARLRVVGLIRSVALSALRLVMGLAVGLAIAALFGLEGVARGVLILDCAMPVAVFNYIMAERYGQGSSEVASMVVISTALSFATLPLLLLIVL